MNMLECARTNFFSCEYTRIANEHLLKARCAINGLYNNHPDYDQQDILHHDAIMWSIISVVFSAMSIESFIYNYAASYLNDKYVKEHLDKLGVVDKWVIIPRLITGKQINKSECAFNLLKEVIGFRNEYVHNKSEPLTYKNWGKEDVGLYLSQAEKGIKAIEYLAVFIRDIDPTYPVMGNFGVEWKVKKTNRKQWVTPEN